MKAERKQKITDILKGGKMIFRFWQGSNRSGCLSYSLEGIKRLSKNDFEELKKDGLIVADLTDNSAFKRYKIK